MTPRMRPNPDDLGPVDRRAWLEGDLVKARTFVANALGLLLSTVQVVGVVWLLTHLGVVFG